MFKCKNEAGGCIAVDHELNLSLRAFFTHRCVVGTSCFRTAYQNPDRFRHAEF